MINHPDPVHAFMKTELTERYIWAVVRRLPQTQRPAIERELRSLLAAKIDEHVAAGADAPTAERDAVLELGDPQRRAANEANPPLHVIVPGHYLDYLRLLKLLMGIAVPIAALAALLRELLSGSGVGESIAAAVVTAVNVAIQVAFWVTIVFTVIEHINVGERPRTTWTPDQLPRIPSRSRITVPQTLINAAGLLIFAGAIIWQQFSSLFIDGNSEPIPLLTPGLWSLWLPYFLLLTAVAILLVFLKLVQGWWTWKTASLNVVLVAAFTIPGLWLLNGERLLNPDFLAMAQQATTLHLKTPDFFVITSVIVIGLSVWNIIDGFVKARWAHRDLDGFRAGISQWKTAG